MKDTGDNKKINKDITQSCAVKFIMTSYFLLNKLNIVSSEKQHNYNFLLVKYQVHYISFYN